jgi:hypothetical protein
VAGRDLRRLDLTKEETAILNIFRAFLLNRTTTQTLAPEYLSTTFTHLLLLNFFLLSDYLPLPFRLQHLTKHLQDGQSVLRRLGAVGEDDLCMYFEHHGRALTNM